MICPLKMLEPMREGQKRLDIICLKEECEWWLQENNSIGAPAECSLKRFAMAVGNIQWHLGRIFGTLEDLKALFLLKE